MRRFPAAAGRAVRRRLCTASSSAELPELSRWGSFGKSAAQVETLEQAIRQDGERQVAITKEIAAIGIKFQAMLTRPVQYFTDAEWREGWLAAADEPLLRFSRLNEKLREGWEAAYEAVAAEFHADEPDIEQFVGSGAIDFCAFVAAHYATAAAVTAPQKTATYGTRRGVTGCGPALLERRWIRHCANNCGTCHWICG